MSVCDFKKYDLSILCRYLRDKWFEHCELNDIIIGAQIRELILMRDSINDNVLTETECREIINYLCTC